MAVSESGLLVGELRLVIGLGELSFVAGLGELRFRGPLALGALRSLAEGQARVAAAGEIQRFDP